MAKGKKTGGKDFQKGTVPNPNGRPKLPADIKQARALNKIELERILNKYLYLSRPELNEALTRPDLPAIELTVGKILSEALKRGDEKRLDFILTRAVGAVKKVYEHSGPDGGPIEHKNLSEIPDSELKARINELLADRTPESKEEG